MTEKKTIKENELENIAGGQTNNVNRSTDNKSREEDLGGRIHIDPTDEHIEPFVGGK